MLDFITNLYNVTLFVNMKDTHFQYLQTCFSLITFVLGNTEIADDGAKQYEAMYSSCEPPNSSSVEETAANGMVLAPEDLGYQLYEVPGKYLAYTVPSTVCVCAGC